ncbi:hypothetical protein [Maritimibacter dapengensis]|uniref:Uncharacterized protein n=1 Tax=Maritimibacter dapengensis TaxID=2836868 RepID=A0ABS6SWM2_9RHOB|nr:hypothetical protein [Maritimibacter dapengensis]MBV7377359.1 hypothetical protein [Maritimibacter dapengensis]
MSFVRPEVMQGLARWREALIGAVVLIWGVWWIFTGVGAFVWIGFVLAAIGASLAWSGVQRARFRTGSGGIGVVEVDERQVTYLSPVGGGMVSLETLLRVEIARDRLNRAVWRFTGPEESLSIPSAAEGSRALFDVLTALDGARIETAIRALATPPETPVTIWAKDGSRADLRLTPPAQSPKR